MSKNMDDIHIKTLTSCINNLFVAFIAINLKFFINMNEKSGVFCQKIQCMVYSPIL